MMKKSIGFPISGKENEKRRALLPADLEQIKNPDCLFFEDGYGDVLHISANAYTQYGARFVSREEVLTKNIICDPKIGDADYLDNLSDQVIFGWVHAVQNRDITDKLIRNRLTAYAWEDMFIDGRHVFWRNNEIAGEAAVLHAITCYGLMPYNIKAALIGRGNCGNGAYKLLAMLGADVTVYTRHTEKLLREELGQYDVVVNAVLWDTTRQDHIIYREDLRRMKPGAMIIDISCDRCGGIESSRPTTIESPVYVVDGITHYAVDHTPSLFYKTASAGISRAAAGYLDKLCEDTPCGVLEDALCVKEGRIVDRRINTFQGR